MSQTHSGDIGAIPRAQSCQTTRYLLWSRSGSGWIRDGWGMPAGISSRGTPGRTTGAQQHTGAEFGSAAFRSPAARVYFDRSMSESTIRAGPKGRGNHAGGMTSFPKPVRTHPCGGSDCHFASESGPADIDEDRKWNRIADCRQESASNTHGIEHRSCSANTPSHVAQC